MIINISQFLSERDLIIRDFIINKKGELIREIKFEYDDDIREKLNLILPVSDKLKKDIPNKIKKYLIPYLSINMVNIVKRFIIGTIEI